MGLIRRLRSTYARNWIAALLKTLFKPTKSFTSETCFILADVCEKAVKI